MSLFKVFNIAGSGMAAQSVRLNVTASNIANADSVSSSSGATYRAREPVFAPALQAAQSAGGGNAANTASVGVRVLGVVESQAPLHRVYQPDSPAADANGYVYRPNVNVVDELANMISASRGYQADVQMVNTSKQMLLRTLTLGQ